MIAGNGTHHCGFESCLDYELAFRLKDSQSINRKAPKCLLNASFTPTRENLVRRLEKVRKGCEELRKCANRYRFDSCSGLVETIITIRATHTEPDVKFFSSVIKERIRHMFEGTALHVSNITVKNINEYMVTGWINGSSLNQTRIVIHCSNAGEAYESAVKAFAKNNSQPVTIIKIELQ